MVLMGEVFEAKGIVPAKIEVRNGREFAGKSE